MKQHQPHRATKVEDAGQEPATARRRSNLLQLNEKVRKDLTNIINKIINNKQLMKPITTQRSSKYNKIVLIKKQEK